MFTAYAQNLSATGNTASEAVNYLLPSAITKQFGDWGQKVTSTNKIADFFVNPSSPNVRANVQNSKFWNAYTKSMEETMLTPASEWEIHLEYKNPSALVEHREACPTIRQVLKVVVVG